MSRSFGSGGQEGLSFSIQRSELPIIVEIDSMVAVKLI